VGAFLLFALFSYVLGSVPVGLLFARRLPQSAFVIVTFFLDVVKGALPIILAASFGFSVETQAAFGLFAFLGHCFPVWARFYGGKGVAVGYGVFWALSPWIAFLGLCGFVVSRWVVKDSGLAFLLAFLLMLACGFFMLGSGLLKFILAAMVLIIVLRHQESLRRLFGSRGD
jgi:glycerol-3-phosphate acyltransferase PlsY